MVDELKRAYMQRLLMVAGIVLMLVTFIPVLLAASAARPNVLLIITDDQGYGDLACHGNPVIKTPALDRLHDESIRLTNFHVSPTCAPTRAALMTGRYTDCTGSWHTIMGRSLMNAEEVTLAQCFKASGYRTGMFGKWHLGDNFPCRPQDQGFDVAIVNGGGGVSQTPDFFGNDYFDDTYFHNGKPEKFTGYCNDVWFARATDFIRANRHRPFFCYLATNLPHHPYRVPEKYIDLYRDKVFVLTPLARTSAGAIALAKALVQAIGAHPLLLDPARHDRAVAAISHLPYLLAASLVNAAAEFAQKDELVWKLAASGFRDTSRVAAGSIPMMMDILATNREPILTALRQAQRELDFLAQCLEKNDFEKLRGRLEEARQHRLEVFP